MKENILREDIAAWGRELSRRGYFPGSSGNLSVRLADGFLVTPTSAWTPPRSRNWSESSPGAEALPG